MRHHFVKDMAEDGVVNIQYVSTSDMFANILLRDLTTANIGICRERIGSTSDETTS